MFDKNCNYLVFALNRKLGESIEQNCVDFVNYATKIFSFMNLSNEKTDFESHFFIFFI